MKVRYFNIAILNVFLLVTLSVSVYGNVYNTFYGQAVPIRAETPKVVLQSGTAGTSTIYTNNTSAKVSVVAPRNWWNLDYDYRRQISIINNVASTLASGYSVCLIVNTASLVSGGKMLPSGNDLRIVYLNGSSWVEIDRDVIDMNAGSTKVWFKTRAGISASGSDNNYYVYYGNPSAASPPANKSNVYDFWDDFNDGSLGSAWTFSQIGGASGSCSESGTVVILNATNSGDLWDASDNLLFLSISRSYDVLVESYTSSWGGSHQTWSKMGGVQLRQSLDANSKNRIMSPVYSAVGATNSYRLSTGGSTFEQTTSTQPKYCRLSRIEGTSRAWYSTNGVSWTELGSQISFSGGLSNPICLGIHLAGLSSSSHWVEVDWFKVRKYVDPEPSTSVGPEESHSYYPTGYNVLAGNYVSGSVPESVQAVDSDYLVIRSAGSATSTLAYNPSGYSLLGGTTLVSGDIGNLTSNDGVYMTFRSYFTGTATSYNPSGYNLLGSTKYVSGALTDLQNDNSVYMTFRSSVSASSTTAKTNAFIAYRDSTTSLNTPKERTWTGDTTSWGAQAELPVLIFGKTSIGGSSASHSTTNSKMACKYSPTTSGTITSISIYISMDGDATIYLGIYSDNAGTPGTLLGSGSVATTMAVGWKTVSGLSISVTSGTNYWLMINWGSQQVTYYYDVGSTNQFIYQANSADTPPPDASFGGGTYLARAMSIYAAAESPVRFTRVAYSPIEARSYEKIVVTLSDDWYLDAYVWDGTSWNVTNNIGFVGTAIAYKCFDVTYEKTSGKALLVYALTSPSTTQDLAYRTWTFGSGWSSQQYIDDTGHSTDIQYYWVSLASNPMSGSNEITMVALDGTDSDGNGWVWNGSSWGSMYELDASVAIITKECIAVAYEQTSGIAWTAVGSATTVNTFDMRSQTGGTWSSTKQNPNVGGVPNWCTLKADPASNYLLLVSVDAGSDLNTVYYSGSGSWTIHPEHDAAVDSNAQRCADFAWEPTGSKGLLVYGTTTGVITYRTFTAPATWGTITSTAMAGGIHPWVQLRTNPRNIAGDMKILGAVLTGTVFDIGAIRWDGTTFTVIGTNTISSDTTVITYECFEMEFMNFGPPTEFSSEVEFTGTSNTDVWSQLMWTVDSAWDTANVTVTIQLYDWNPPGYPTSGDGYTTYTSSATPNTDETKTQTITTNPQNYRDSNGNWKIKIKGVKSTSTQFQFKADWAEYKPTKAEYTSEVEFTGSSNTWTWTQLVWSIDSAWTVGSVSVTIKVYNYTLGDYPTSGDGYDSYTSNPTANTDQTRTQTITTNSQDFRNATGNWKIKIKGVKNTNTQFDFKADWIEFKPTHYSEYTVSTEFLFSSMTKNTPTQLNFTVVSEYDIADVSVTIQVWNYSSSTYVKSGEGYLTYTSTGVNETKLLSINTSPQFYTSNGKAKINVTGVKSTTTQFQQKINQIKLTYQYNASSTYNYVLEVVNKVSNNWTVNLQVYNSTNINRLSSLNISLHDGTSSNQIAITGGSIIQPEGPPYNLAGNATIYISISNLQATTTDTSHLCVYVKILVPNTSTYNLFIIVFEIT
jgi:hypothetical protein